MYLIFSNNLNDFFSLANNFDLSNKSDVPKIWKKWIWKKLMSYYAVEFLNLKSKFKKLSIYAWFL